MNDTKSLPLIICKKKEQHQSVWGRK